jgi:predicted transporter
VSEINLIFVLGLLIGLIFGFGIGIGVVFIELNRRKFVKG